MAPKYGRPGSPPKKRRRTPVAFGLFLCATAAQWTGSATSQTTAHCRAARMTRNTNIDSGSIANDKRLVWGSKRPVTFSGTARRSLPFMWVSR